MSKEMGEKEEISARRQVQQSDPKTKIVDIQEKQREAIANMDRTPEEEEQVQQILKNPDIWAPLVGPPKIPPKSWKILENSFVWNLEMIGIYQQPR